MNTTNARMNTLLKSAAAVRAIDIDCFSQAAMTNAAHKLINMGLLTLTAPGKASITDAGRAALAAVPAEQAAPVAVRAAKPARLEMPKTPTTTAPKGRLFASTVILPDGSARTVTRAKPYAFAVLKADGSGVVRWTNV